MDSIPRRKATADIRHLKSQRMRSAECPGTTNHLAAMDVHLQRPTHEGRSYYRIAFISDPDGNLIELMQIGPESSICRE